MYKFTPFNRTDYDIEDCNVTAVARLRGNSIKTFNIPFKCIGVYSPEAEEGTSSCRLYVKPDLGEKVSILFLPNKLIHLNLFITRFVITRPKVGPQMAI